MIIVYSLPDLVVDMLQHVHSSSLCVTVLVAWIPVQFLTRDR